jgi:hypothetical protein
VYLIRKELLGDWRFVHIKTAIPGDSDCLKIVSSLNDMDLIVICHCLLKRPFVNEVRSDLLQHPQYPDCNPSNAAKLRPIEKLV